MTMEFYILAAIIFSGRRLIGWGVRNNEEKICKLRENGHLKSKKTSQLISNVNNGLEPKCKVKMENGHDKKQGSGELTICDNDNRYQA